MLDAVALPAGNRVPAMRVLSRWIGRDDGDGAGFCQPVPQPTRIMGAVCEKARWRSGNGKQRLGTVEIMAIAGRQDQGERPSGRVGQGVELAGASAARASDGIGKGPPFEPAAARWTLICVLSTEAVTLPITPVDPVRASNIPCHTPCRL